MGAFFATARLVSLYISVFSLLPANRGDPAACSTFLPYARLHRCLQSTSNQSLPTQRRISWLLMNRDYVCSSKRWDGLGTGPHRYSGGSTGEVRGRSTR